MSSQACHLGTGRAQWGLALHPPTEFHTMIQLSTRIALLAFVGMLSAAPAAFAAPMNNNNTSAGQNDANGGSQAINCALPENKLNPLCTQKHIFNGTHGPNGGGNNGNNTTTTNTTGNTTTNT